MINKCVISQKIVIKSWLLPILQKVSGVQHSPARHACDGILHLSYCITTWERSSQTTIQPIISLYNQTLKMTNIEVCTGVTSCKNVIFSFESFISNLSLKHIFKCLHGRAPSSLNDTSTSVETQPYLDNHSMELSRTELKMQHNFNVSNRGFKSWLNEKQHCSHT